MYIPKVDAPHSTSIDATPEYEKEIKKLRKKYRAIERDLEPLIDRLRAGETPGDRVSNSRYPIYKVRIRNTNLNKGQSGGYRVIYYTIATESVLLTAIYSKSERENMSTDEIETRIDRYQPPAINLETKENMPIESEDDFSE